MDIYLLTSCIFGYINLIDYRINTGDIKVERKYSCPPSNRKCPLLNAVTTNDSKIYPFII